MTNSEIKVGDLNTVTIAADHDARDCLAEAAARYVEDHPELAGYDLDPQWEYDDERDTVSLTVPSWHLAGAPNATIHESGNGLVEVGDYVPGDDGELYLVATLIGPIHTGQRSGESNYVHARVELADWDDVEEDEIATSQAILL